MKNRILTLIAACMAALCASAQTTDSLPDTLTNRPSSYYYYNWYDTCVMFKAGIDTYSLYNLTRQKANPSNVMHGVIANEHITKSHMAVKGLAAMVVSSSTTWPVFPPLHPTVPRLPEYLILAQGVGFPPNSVPQYVPQLIVPLDSARWDTLSPRVWRFPRTYRSSDSADYLYCYLYEVYFQQPVVVDSFFYIVGTVNNPFVTFPDSSVDYHLPTAYAAIFENTSDEDHDFCMSCGLANRVFYGRPPLTEEESLIYCSETMYFIGPFFPIVDFYTLTLESNDSVIGMVLGSGRYPALTSAEATALPALGYSFLHWSDGVTDNPRQIEMTQDTTLTAVFGIEE